MDVRYIPIKLKNRLNKLGSFDFDNLECWQIIEAYNKAQRDTVRNQIKGTNIERAGDEATRMLVDDLQMLLKPVTLHGLTRQTYFESEPLPTDYFGMKRVTGVATKGSCQLQRIKCRQVEEANIDVYIEDPNMEPSFIWRESFFTIMDNKVRVYTNGDFAIDSIELIYYRYPREINLSGCKDYAGVPGVNVNPELGDDLVEIIVDNAAAILAGDIQDINTYQIAKQRSEQNT